MGNPKHKPVPSPGKRGSICPPLAPNAVQALLEKSIQVGRKRYASDGNAAFCAHCHDATNDIWHGFPVSWNEVDPRARRQLVDAGQVDKRVVRRQMRGAS